MTIGAGEHGATSACFFLGGKLLFTKGTFRRDGLKGFSRVIYISGL